MELEDNFKKSPMHDKHAILEMMNKLDPKEMVKVVDFIQEQVKLSCPPVVSRSKNGGVEKNLLKTYHIETFDERAYLNFYTEAKNKKEALGSLLNKSLDFKNLTVDDRDWIIKIKEIK